MTLDDYYPNKDGGARMALIFNSPQVNNNCRWAQWVITDDAVDGHVACWDSKDGTMYYPNQFYGFLDEHTITFGDNPYSDFSRSFRAVTMLLDGNNKPILNLYWGYDFNSSQRTVYMIPARVTYYRPN